MKPVVCLLCGSGESHEIFRNRGDKYFRQLPHLRGRASILVMCTQCGLAYHNPQLDEAEARFIYSKLYRPPAPTPAYLAMKRRDFVEGDLAWLRRALAQTGRPPGRVLEVGCSEGTLLSLLREDGWDTYGVDPSESFSDFARHHYGLKVATEFFGPETFAGLRFDLIVVNATVEHLHDPVGLLATARDRVAADGVVYVGTPHLLALAGNLRKHHLNSVHLYLFTERTLPQLLSRAGLTPLVLDLDPRGRLLRTVAVPADRFAPPPPGIDDYRHARREIRRHQRRWLLTAEWKERVQQALIAGLGPSRGQRVVDRLRRLMGRRSHA